MPSLDADQREAELVRTILTARGWRISDLRTTETELLLIASRPKRATPLEAARQRDME